MRRPRIMSKMKRLEIVMESHQLPAIAKIVERHATGYTTVPDATGFGHHGCRDRDITILVSVVTSDHLEWILDEVSTLLHACSGVVLVTDVSVLRAEHFMPEVRDARAPVEARTRALHGT